LETPETWTASLLFITIAKVAPGFANTTNLTDHNSVQRRMNSATLK